MEVITSERSGESYVYDGFVYRKSRSMPKKNTSYFICSFSDCKGRAIVKNGKVHQSSPHYHDRQDVQIAILRLRVELRKAARACPRSLKAAFYDIISRHKLAAKYVTYENVRSLMFSAKAKSRSSRSGRPQSPKAKQRKSPGNVGWRRLPDAPGSSNDASHSDTEYCGSMSKDGDDTEEYEFLESLDTDVEDYSRPEDHFMRPVSVETEHDIDQLTSTEPISIDSEHDIVRRKFMEPECIVKEEVVLDSSSDEDDSSFDITAVDRKVSKGGDNYRTPTKKGKLNRQDLNTKIGGSGISTKPGYQPLTPVVGLSSAVTCSSAPTVSVVTTFPSSMATTTTASSTTGLIPSVPMISSVMSLPTSENNLKSAQPFLILNPQALANMVILPTQEHMMSQQPILVSPFPGQMTNPSLEQANTTLRPILPKGTEPPPTAPPFASPLSEPPNASSPTVPLPLLAPKPSTQSNSDPPSEDTNSHLLPFLNQHYSETDNVIKIDLNFTPIPLRIGIKVKVRELCSAMFLKRVNPKDIIIASPL